MFKKLLAEFIGTFLFVAVIGLTAVAGGAPAGFAAIPIGLALAVMVYATGHISGGHLNPAVTLAVALRGKCAWREVVPYWVAQLAGAALAACLVKCLMPEAIAKATAVALQDAVKTVDGVSVPAFDTAKALIAELVGTFALAFVVLNVATAKGTAGNSFYGFAIGTTVLVMAFAFGGISGGAFNPAIATGLAVLGAFSAKGLWIYFAADLAGAALAALAFRAMRECEAPGDGCKG